MKKLITKIIIFQLGFLTSDIIFYNFKFLDIETIIITHLCATICYFYGVSDCKKSLD